MQSPRVAKPATDSTTRFVSTQLIAHTCVWARGGEGNAQILASGRASMPAKFARVALCCAGAKPGACGIAELEYGNPLDLRVINTHIRTGFLQVDVPLGFGYR
eukprot:5307656-Pleurochrysis_carterae.AAC.4